MRLYYRNPGQVAEFVLDGADYDLNLILENDLGDGIAIFSDVGHIRMGARLRAVSDSGEVLFLGVVCSIEYSASGGKHRYDCIAAEALLQGRIAPNIIYSGGIGLSFADIFSSDAPPQGAGFSQYCMPLLWLAISKICDGIDSGMVSWDADGIGTLAGWGPLVSGHDIYYGGRLLAETTLSELSGETDSYVIQGGNLYVRGLGAGDIYDVIAADGWTENYVRLGSVATDSEIESPFGAGESDIWSLIRDLVSETGQYIVFRRDEDGYVYLDISASPKARGSESEPFASLRVRDDFIVQKFSPPKYPSYACVVGLGAAYDGVWGQRCGVAGGPIPLGTAWRETSYYLGESRVSPLGNLDGATEDFFGEIHQDPPVEIVLFEDRYLPGDWLQLNLDEGQRVVGQIKRIRKSSSGPDVAVVGSPDLSILTAFLARSETDAIEAYRAYSENVADGEAVRYGWFGVTETFSDHFVTIDWEGEEVPILLSMEVDDPEDITDFSSSVFIIIDINDYVIKLPWMAWGPNPITDFDIGPYCHRDTSEETIEISIEDPAGWIPYDYIFKVTITGLGADSVADTVTLDIANSTLNDMNTGTYFDRTTLGTSNYNYQVEDIDVMPSKSPTVRVWIRSYGNSYGDYFADAGFVYWYGESATLLVVGGGTYYGSWIIGNWGWTYTDYAQNPATGEDWTLEEIQSIQAGGAIRVRCTYAPPITYVLGGVYARLYDAYVEVLP